MFVYKKQFQAVYIFMLIHEIWIIRDQQGKAKLSFSQSFKNLIKIWSSYMGFYTYKGKPMIMYIYSSYIAHGCINAYK